MKVFNICDFGAVGDGVLINTEAIQRAIDECHGCGGGRVVVSNGHFVTGTLRLYSNIDFRIERNSVLMASTNGEDYPDFPCDEWNTEFAPRATARCLIYVGYCSNTSISGMGKIDCRGSSFCDKITDENGKVKYVRNTSELPARMIFIMGCTNIRLCDFTMEEMAGGWGSWINDSQYISADNIKMICNPEYPNADGIHINCCSDVTVTNCIIHSGDDSIIVRANTKTLKKLRVCERIIVKGCVLSSNHNPVRIAWRNDGVIRNCTFSDLIITDSRQGITIELPDHSSPTDFSDNYTRVNNLRFNNIVLDRVSGTPVKVYIYPENQVDELRQINFSNITSVSGLFPVVVGREDSIISDVCFNNCTFSVENSSSESYPIFKHTKNLQLNNTLFNVR